mmetsp:Transcript_23690/g.32533  ORF Transcript_23690/g.32533 Transcript_23690/m.32533 type:complete len:177 (-) Transcript_23690:54-584(-)
MEFWTEILLCSFLTFVFFHLLLQDFGLVYNIILLTRQNPHNQPLSNHQQLPSVDQLPQDQSGIQVMGLNNVEEGTRSTPGNSPNFTAQQSSLIILLLQVCDVVLACIMGYFYTFCFCWDKILICFRELMVRYINFLVALVKALTRKEAIVYTSVSAVLAVLIGFVMLFIVLTALKD